MTNIPDYLGYTVKINQIANIHKWCQFWPIYIYDREYRRQQPALGHAWGLDNPHLHTVYLQRKQYVPKGPNPPSSEYSVNQTQRAPLTHPRAKKFAATTTRENAHGVIGATGHMCVTTMGMLRTSMQKTISAKRTIKFALPER